MRIFSSTDSDLGQKQSRVLFSKRDIGLMMLVFLAYFLSARLELRLIHSQVSMGVIWLPAGIAFAAILLRGYRVVPVIFLASLCIELSSSVPLLGALTIAGGSAAEVLHDGYLVNRFAGGVNAFSRPGDVLRFSLLGGAFATVVSAVVGANVLGSTGFVQGKILPIFAAWWAGHALG